MQDIRRRPDTSIDVEFYSQQAHRERSVYVRQTLSPLKLLISTTAKGRVTAFAAAFAVASGAFWATMLTSPPTTEAANPALSISELQRKAPVDLPTMMSDAH